MDNESIEEMLSSEHEENIDTTVPVSLGLDDNKLNEVVEYLASSSSDVPKFVESFNKEKLKNITSIATITQLSRVPSLIKQLNEINSIIVQTNVYRNMEPADLIKTSNNLSNELRLILDTARKTLETLNTLEAPPSANQKLLDQILQMPEQDILAMKQFVESKRNNG